MENRIFESINQESNDSEQKFYKKMNTTKEQYFEYKDESLYDYFAILRLINLLYMYKYAFDKKDQLMNYVEALERISFNQFTKWHGCEIKVLYPDLIKEIKEINCQSSENTQEMIEFIEEQEIIKIHRRGKNNAYNRRKHALFATVAYWHFGETFE